jgi:Flp pilus assembly pilin Flp
MKTYMKRLLRDEKGASLVMVLILLLISGLIIGPLLSYMGTGLITGEVYEMRTDELYAADAGVEDAIWRIPKLGLCLHQSTNFTIPNINGKKVEVTINCTYEDEQGKSYLVKSTATGGGSGTVATVSGTQIDAYIIGTYKYGDYSNILENVITTLNQIGPPSEDKKNIHIIAEGHEPVENYPEEQWPDAGQLISFYSEQVEGVTPYDSDEIILIDDVSKGPIYSDMEGLLTIESSSEGATLTLNDTIYITGETLVGKTGDYMKLNLNNNTIFIQSNAIGSQKAFWLGGKCEVEGPGVIVAIGDIELAPSYSIGSEAGPVFVMSISGSTTLRPGADQGDFYGCIAGNVTVVVQSGSDVDMKYPEEEGWYEDFNFPVGNIPDQQLIYSVDSWQVTHLSPNDLGG